jgi:RNA polymerase sigma-70 factor (ECF subfamily)
MRYALRRNRPLERLGDEELMRLVSQRDSAAFRLFYDRHGPAAYSLAYRMVGDPKLAEDVTQEALLSIWRSGAAYDPARGSVRSWTLRIVRNRAIDLLRRESLRPAPPRALDEQEAIEERPASERTDAEALRRETARELRGALARLPADQSQVIELAYFGGFSHSEIATMLDMPLGTVKGRMRLGLEKVRGELAEGMSAEGLP